MLAYTTCSDIRGQPLYIHGCSLLAPVSGLFSCLLKSGRIHNGVRCGCFGRQRVTVFMSTRQRRGSPWYGTAAAVNVPGASASSAGSERPAYKLLWRLQHSGARRCGSFAGVPLWWAASHNQGSPNLRRLPAPSACKVVSFFARVNHSSSSPHHRRTLPPRFTYTNCLHEHKERIRRGGEGFKGERGGGEFFPCFLMLPPSPFWCPARGTEA